MTQGSEPQLRPPQSPAPQSESPFELLRVVVSAPRPGVLAVAPAGEVDVATADMLRNAVMHAVRTAPHDVVVDLRGLTFCGSTGLVVLLECRQAAAATGVGFGVLGGPPIVRRVMDITGLGPVLHHRDTLDEVLAAAQER
jgi:anti-anti-sigma factor